MASIDDKNLVQVSGTVPAAAQQVQQTAASGASEAPLFEGTSSTEGVSTTDRTDDYVSSSSTNGVKSAEMSALEAQLAEKQSAVADIDTEIEANDALKEEKKSAYETAGNVVNSASAAYNTAARNYAAALNELEELKSGNFFESIINTVTLKISQAEKKVAELKQQAEQARKDYEEAIEERNNAREEYAAAIQEGIGLKQDRIKAQEEVASIQKEIQDLAKKESEEQAQTAETQEQAQTVETQEQDNGSEAPATTGDGGDDLSKLQKLAETNPELQALLSGYGENITEDEIKELAGLYLTQETEGANEQNPPAGDVDTNVPTDPALETGSAELDNLIGSDLAILDQLNQDKQNEMEIFNKTPDIFEFDAADVDKIVELFCGELTHDEVRGLGMGLLDMVDEAAKMFETKLSASAYSKSGAMATSDSATTEEHSEAQSDFTEAVLQVSDIVNNMDVEFYNVSDQSNFELASHTLDRINEGEYIKTDTLEKQTSIVKNIRVTEKTNTEAVSSNDEKYRQYSDAILGELHELIENSENGITEEEYNSIKTNFDLKASQNMESAFDYLEEEARKHNITAAINEYEN